MNILTVIESLGPGGAERALTYVLPRIHAMGHDCSVLALWPPYTLAPKLEKEGIRVIRLDLSHRWNIPEALRKMRKALAGTPIDVIHGHLFFGGLYTALSRTYLPGARRVVTFHNLGYDSYPATTAWLKLRKRIDSWLMRRWIDSKIAVSRSVASHYSTHLLLDDVAVVLNGLPMHDLGAPPRRQPRSDPEILSLGRLVPEKGHRFLLEALEQLRERGFSPSTLIVGDGPEERTIRNLIQERQLDPQVAMKPTVDHQEAQELLRAAGLLVVSSTHEGFPIAVLEALALCTPLVATAVGGIVDIVKNGETGLLVPPRDPLALAGAIERLLRDDELRYRIGQRGRALVTERFDVDIQAAALVQIYESVLDRAAP